MDEIFMRRRRALLVRTSAPARCSWGIRNKSGMVGCRGGHRRSHDLSGGLEAGGRSRPNLRRGTKFFGGAIFNRLFLSFRNNASHKQASRFHCHELSG